MKRVSKPARNNPDPVPFIQIKNEPTTASNVQFVSSSNVAEQTSVHLKRRLDSLSIEIDRLQNEIETKSFKRKQLEEINRKLTETRNQNNLTLKQNAADIATTKKRQRN